MGRERRLETYKAAEQLGPGRVEKRGRECVWQADNWAASTEKERQAERELQM